MRRETPGSGRARVLYVLKMNGPQTAAEMANRLGITAMAVRQHLAGLSGERLVEFTDQRRQVGRPARLWRLSAGAAERFPDRHAELAVGLLQAVRRVGGEDGVQHLTEERTRAQAERYRARLPDAEASVDARLRALARLRREEGYMAAWRRQRDGTLELVEHHCAIMTAACACPQLCDSELSLFQAVLGGGVAIERTAHILAGDRCCAYRIRQESRRPR